MLQTNTALKPVEQLRQRVSVPLADLRAQYNALRSEMISTMLEVAGSTDYILGPRVQSFEENFASFIGAKHCVGVNSGTSALHLAMICAGVGMGDEVITVPMTFVATAWGIRYVGATPVFVDIDPATYTMDVAKVEARITSRTRAILPVHLYGQPADMAPLLQIAKRYGIPVIEDAAQAHGARYNGLGAGSMGLCGCFSFYPGKNLGAYGEAGAVVTNDDDVAARLRRLRDHGQQKRYHHDELGFNYRMDGLQGAVLDVKLRYLKRWTDARRGFAQRYAKRLAGLPVQLPAEAAGRESVWHLYVVLHPERDRIRQELQELGIQTGLHYPIPLHLQRAFADLGGKPGDFPVAEQIAAQCMTLPLFAEMTVAQQDAVIETLSSIL